jgi:hypothetical protein
MTEAKERQAEMGQAVHYVLCSLFGARKERPAIITEAAGLYARLVVFPAYGSDFPMTGILVHALLNAVHHSADKLEGTWHWPEE